MISKNGGPAFPNGLKGEVKLAGNRYDGAHVPEYDSKFQGMTLRDYFAAKAMQGFASQEGWQFSHLAESAYQLADAMLAEREKTND